MKEFKKMIDGTGPDSQRIQETVDYAFSAFRQVRKSFSDTLATMNYAIPKDLLRESYLTIHSFIK